MVRTDGQTIAMPSRTWSELREAIGVIDRDKDIIRHVFCVEMETNEERTNGSNEQRTA